MTKHHKENKDNDDLNTLIEISARQAGFQGERRNKSEKMVKTVGDLMRFGKFIDSILNQYRRRGIMKVLGSVLGCSPNRVGEWHKIYLGAIYTDSDDVKSLLQSDDDVALVKLLDALKASGWHTGQAVRVGVNLSVVNNTTTKENAKRTPKPTSKPTQRYHQQYRRIESQVVATAVDDRPLKYASIIKRTSHPMNSISCNLPVPVPVGTYIDVVGSHSHSHSYNHIHGGHCGNGVGNDTGSTSNFENRSNSTTPVGISDEDASSVFTFSAAGTWILEPDMKKDLDQLSPFDLNSLDVSPT